MSVKSFIPELWTSKVLGHLDKAHRLVNLCNRDYEGEITQWGDTVRIGQVGPVTIGNYAPNATVVTPEQLNATQQVLTIDKGKYFTFYIDDVDQAQTKPKLMEEGTKRGAYELADDIDLEIAALYSQAGLTLTTNGSTAINSANILAVMAAASQNLDEASVPSEGRWLAAPPWFIARLKLAKVLQTDGSVDAGDTLASGALGNVFGFEIHQSNNITTSGTGHAHTSYILAGTKDAISYAEQVVEMEAFRPEAKFADAIKSLTVYGYKVVQPNALLSITAVETTEV